MLVKRTGKHKINIPCWMWAFLLNLGVALLAILPSIIKNDGYMAMSHDFSAQEITFNMLMNETVKSGNWLWNWGIDLGGNFLESFSFYNVGSIFFWITLLFPAKLVSRVMGWMIILKYAVAGATSAAFFARHLKSKGAVLFASLLYAFSGYQCGTIVFYHFQDQVALFPLMLIGLELLVEEKKRGRLLFACVLNVMSNYVFFVGEVLFLVIYYVVKYLIPQIKEGGKKLWEHIAQVFGCITEGLLGMAVSGALLLPSIWGTMSNSRVTTHILPQNWFSMSTGDWMMILKGLLMPAEPMNYMSSVAYVNWMSNMAYLPMVGLLLVMAYVFTKKDWLSTILKICAVLAAVPVLNNIFMFFSEENYRRWYYMAILFMALASAKVLEDAKHYRIKTASVSVVGLYVLYFGMLLSDWDGLGNNLIYRKEWFVFGAAVAVVGVVVTWAIILFGKKLRSGLMCGVTAMFSALVVATVLFGYQSTTDNANIDFKTFEHSYGENTDIYLTEISAKLDKDVLPYRYYFDEGIGHTYYNLAMTTGLPSINSFMSTVHSSVAEFYEVLGAGRKTWTNADNSGSRELLGAKYIVSVFEQGEYTPIGTMTNKNGQILYLYENEAALPIGFTYDMYITEDELLALGRDARATAMLGVLTVKAEDVPKVEGILEHCPAEVLAALHPDARWQFMEERRAESSVNFEQGDNCFSSQITAAKEKYAFFSVPYDASWKACVNGEEREILNVNGLMAVKIDAGLNEISFTYEYRMITLGIAISVLGIIGTCLYLFENYRRNKRKVIQL